MKKVCFLFFLILTLCFFTVGCKKDKDQDNGEKPGGEDEVEVDWSDLHFDQQENSLYDLI